MASNRLIKNILRQFIPGLAAVPASPGQPYVAPYWETVIRTTLISYGRYLILRYRHGRIVEGLFYMHEGYVEYRYADKVYNPGQPYIPPTPAAPERPEQFVEDYNLGWTGRAHSFGAVSDMAKVRFSVTPGTVGAVVGLGFEQNATEGYKDILHGVYVESGLYRVIEAGELQTVQKPLPDVFVVEREWGEIRYYADDELVFTSNDAAGEMRLAAALYSGGDEVFDPAIENLDVTAVSTPLTAYAWGADGEVCAVNVPLTCYAQGYAGNSCMVAVPLAAYAWGGDAANPCTVRAPLACYAQGRSSDGEELVPQYCIGETPLVAGYAWGASIEVGSASVSAPLAGYAWGGDAEGLCTVNTPLAARAVDGLSVSFGTWMDAGMWAVSSVQADSYSVMATEFSVIWVSGLQAASVVSWQIEIPVTWVSQLSAESIQELRSTIEAILIDRLTAASQGDTRSGEPPGEVWVLNTSTGGSTRYEDYHFNSFAKLGDAYYGCRADGLYRLDGDTDDGAPVRAMVSFGKQDFGTTALKTTPYAYIGMSASGKMFLKVRVNDDKEYLYAARSTSEHLKTERVDMGRGIRASFVEFELWNEDGADFEVASVEFVAVPLSRRI